MNRKKIYHILLGLTICSFLIWMFFNFNQTKNAPKRDFFVVTPYKRYFYYKYPLVFKKPIQLKVLITFLLPIYQESKYYIKINKIWILVRENDLINQDCSIKTSTS